MLGLLLAGSGDLEASPDRDDYESEVVQGRGRAGGAANLFDVQGARVSYST